MERLSIKAAFYWNNLAGARDAFLKQRHPPAGGIEYLKKLEPALPVSLFRQIIPREVISDVNISGGFGERRRNTLPGIFIPDCRLAQGSLNIP